MKKIWIWFTSALVLGLVAFSTPAVAEPVVGDSWNLGSFCTNVDLEFMRAFTNLVVRGGIPAYQTLITTEGSPCYDRRHNLAGSVSVVLKEKLWGFTLPDGEELVMWRVEDMNGVRGYTWLGPDLIKREDI